MTTRLAVPLLALLMLAPASGRTPQDAPAGDGTVKGKVRFEGKAPKDRKISLEGDAYCGKANPDGLSSEVYRIGAEGAMANVFVYVKKGLPERKWDVPAEAVVLEQTGCRYTPHVFGIMAGQDLKIRNNDETLHNVHAVPQINAEFNFGQAKKGEETVKKFSTPEVGVRIKCDVHGWMATYACVVSHPFHRVTGEDGGFEIKGLPPGEYEIEAWHEKLGTRTQTVKVGAGAAAEASFTFKK